ncbi:hypothetical protein D9V29_04720 [Mycetocola manganoxydans]|uniref:Uncharacterized protein n=1 Tax=Mycetocola manganoxydans TaxID=699879 RepID=A0A3L6ZY81_9MICO|nr:hypothetical protein [Mycetocola manganoxydans]RLP72451.1 hypothetical protein D9V29_04720 [Mycetocola manganoxydans]GHD40225.1 hypothetical protein GCM10008097_04150 [Mycetocola manganoxydans]
MKLLVDCRWVTDDPDDQLSRMSRGIVHALAERRSFVMIVGPSTALDLLPSLPWELLGSPYSPAELLAGRKLSSIGADVVFTPVPGLMGTGRRFRLVMAGGTPAVDDSAGPLSRIRTWPWRFRYTRSWMMRSADLIVGVSRAQQRTLLGDSATDQPVITLHTEDAASVSPEVWRESAAQLDSAIEQLARD